LGEEVGEGGNGENLMGGEEGDSGIWHVGDFGVGGVLHSREVASLVHLEEAVGTVFIGAGEEDAACPRPARLNKRKHCNIYAGPGKVHGLFYREAEIPLFFYEKVIVGGGDVDTSAFNGRFIVGFSYPPTFDAQEGIRDLEAGLAQTMQAQDERELWVVGHLQKGLP